jgi:hypothetical protein
MQTFCPTTRGNLQKCKMLLCCFTSKVVDHGEPLLIVGSQCDYRCVNDMHHIVQHGNQG